MSIALDPVQREAVRYVDGPRLVRRGEGAGDRQQVPQAPQGDAGALIRARGLRRARRGVKHRARGRGTMR